MRTLHLYDDVTAVEELPAKNLAMDAAATEFVKGGKDILDLLSCFSLDDPEASSAGKGNLSCSFFKFVGVPLRDQIRTG